MDFIFNFPNLDVFACNYFINQLSIFVLKPFVLYCKSDKVCWSNFFPSGCKPLQYKLFTLDNIFAIVWLYLWRKTDNGWLWFAWLIEYYICIKWNLLHKSSEFSTEWFIFCYLSFNQIPMPMHLCAKYSLLISNIGIRLLNWFCCMHNLSVLYYI